MSLKITDDRITSSGTQHKAVRLCPDRWTVSWLPTDRRLTLCQAVTAMTIAETVAGMVAQEADHTHKAWALVGTLAAELDLTGADAFARCSEVAS